MNAINDKIGFRQFLIRIFVANSGVSSRRVLAFVFATVAIIMAFCHYEFQIIQLFIIAMLVLLGLTTFSSFTQKSDGETQNNVNINKESNDKG